MPIKKKKKPKKIFCGSWYTHWFQNSCGEESHEWQEHFENGKQWGEMALPIIKI